jgi:hypothetical protein
MGPRPEGKIRQNSQRNAFPSPFRYVTVARASPSPMALGSAGGFIAAAHGEYPRGASDTVWHSDMLTIATAMGGMPPASSAGNASMAVSASVQSCGVNEQVTDVFDPACPGEAGAGLNGRSEPGMGVRAEFAHAESANASAATTIFLRITAGDDGARPRVPTHSAPVTGP